MIEIISFFIDPDTFIAFRNHDRKVAAHINFLYMTTEEASLFDGKLEKLFIKFDYEYTSLFNWLP